MWKEVINIHQGAKSERLAKAVQIFSDFRPAGDVSFEAVRHRRQASTAAPAGQATTAAPAAPIAAKPAAASGPAAGTCESATAAPPPLSPAYHLPPLQAVLATEALLARPAPPALTAAREWIWTKENPANQGRTQNSTTTRPHSCPRIAPAQVSH